MRLRYAMGAVALISGAMTLPVSAQGFAPAKPVEILTHTGPGTGGDVLARTIANVVEKEKLLPVRMHVVNKTGGGGQTAMAYLAEKRGDTHTIAVYAAILITNPLMLPEARLTVKDLTPLVRLLLEPGLIVVKSDAPYRTLADFIDAAKGKPGELRQSGSAIGGRHWLLRQLLMKQTGANWAFVPFPGMSERLAALLGGHTQIMLADPQETSEHVRAGTLRVIAQVADRRLPGYANVPTMKEAGFDATVEQARGVMAPAGIPREAVAYWEELFARMARTPAWKKYLEDNVLEEGYLRSAEHNKFLDDYTESMRSIMRDGGIKVVR